MTASLVTVVMDTMEYNNTVAPPSELDKSEELRIEELKAQLELTRFVVMKILVPIFLVIGVTGNLMNIAVLTRRWMRSSTNFYLTTLAVYDVLYLIFAFTLIIKHYLDVTGMKWYSYYKYHVGVPVTNTCSNTGVWLTLTFTIERYIGVCHPMRGKALCTPERAKYIILVVCAVTAILTAPDFFAKRVIENALMSQSGENITTYSGSDTSFGEAVSYRVGYHFMSQVLFTFMPLILLLVFNSLLIRAVMQANRQRRTMVNMNTVQSERQERHSRDQHRITVMLITVVIVFLLCQSPQAIQNILYAYYDHTNAVTEVKRLLFTITANVFNLFVIINASANFVLYSAFSTKFRRTFSRVFCRCLAKRSSDMLFSETATAMTTVHATNHHDDSRRHLLKENRNKGHTSYNWPRSVVASKNGANDHMNKNSPGGYNHLKKKNGQTIVSCM